LRRASVGGILQREESRTRTAAWPSPFTEKAKDEEIAFSSQIADADVISP
jgi:hypothetical protein